MSNATWCETLVTAQVAGPTLATFTTATTLLPNQAIYTIPSNYFYIGRALRVTATGQMGNTGTPTFTIDFRLGTLATPIIVFNGGAISTLSGANASSTWLLEMIMTCRAVGSGTSANLIGTGTFTSNAVAGSTTAAQATTWMLPATAPAVGTGFDSTVTNVANLFCACSASSASNTITLHQYTLESMN